MTNKKNMTQKELKQIESKKRSEQIAKHKANIDKKIAERIAGLDSQYAKLFQEAMAKQLKKYERKKNIQINRVKKLYGQKSTDKVRAVRKLAIKIRISDNIKDKAITEFQKRSKLSRANNIGQVLLIDKGTRVHRSESVAGHWRPKHNNPQLIFEIDNLRPISNETNYNQLDRPGYIRQEQFISQIGVKRFDELESIAKNKEDKGVIRDKQYYLTIYEIAKAKNAQEKKRLGKYYKKNGF